LDDRLIRIDVPAVLPLLDRGPWLLEGIELCDPYNELVSEDVEAVCAAGEDIVLVSDLELFCFKGAS
jgi:hypothetical protein